MVTVAIFGGLGHQPLTFEGFAKILPVKVLGLKSSAEVETG